MDCNCCNGGRHNDPPAGFMFRRDFDDFGRRRFDFDDFGRRRFEFFDFDHRRHRHHHHHHRDSDGRHMY